MTRKSTSPSGRFLIQVLIMIFGFFLIFFGNVLGQTIVPTSALMPHGMCLVWNGSLIRLHVIADSVIALSYYGIPLALFSFATERSDLMKGWMYAYFAAFIFWCGTTHVMNIVTIWYPVYWVAGLVKIMTAALSLGTCVSLLVIVKRLKTLPSVEDYMEKVLEAEELKKKLDAFLGKD